MTAVLRVGLLVSHDVVEQSRLPQRRRDNCQTAVTTGNGWHGRSVQLHGVSNMGELVEVDILPTASYGSRCWL